LRTRTTKEDEEDDEEGEKKIKAKGRTKTHISGFRDALKCKKPSFSEGKNVFRLAGSI